MPRPRQYHDNTLLCLDSRDASHRLQANSERRAIVTFVMDNGGVATVREVNEHFGFETSGKLSALVNAGWLKVIGEV